METYGVTTVAAGAARRPATCTRVLLALLMAAALTAAQPATFAKCDSTCFSSQFPSRSAPARLFPAFSLFLWQLCMAV